jgi:hypothetical protein
VWGDALHLSFTSEGKSVFFGLDKRNGIKENADENEIKEEA